MSVEYKTVCRLLKLHLPDFFDNIYIPYEFFREEEWNTIDVINQNKDALYYNKCIIDDKSDKQDFFALFKKYKKFINDIFLPENYLYVFMKKWTDQTNVRWQKIKKNSYLAKILNEPKYYYISPKYIAEKYFELSNYHDITICKKKLEENIDTIVSNVKVILESFEKECDEIIDNYVFTFDDFDDSVDFLVTENFRINLNVKKLINLLQKKIISFTEKMLELNVYATHSLINDIITHRVPIININSHDAEESGGKKFTII